MRSATARPDVLRLAAAAEVAAAVVMVVADLLVPTLVLLALAGLSLAARRQRPSSLGAGRPRMSGRTAAIVVGLTVAWSGLQLALLMPVVEHLSGQVQDVSQFAPVQGDLGLLVVLLALSWTLAAVGEEVAYRGYVLTRLREALPAGPPGTVVAVVVSAVLFGLAHTEQGVVGVVLTTFDGLALAALRVRLGSVWPAVLAHGVNNTLGLVTYFVVGPVTGLW